MLSSPLDSTHGWTISSVVCLHGSLAAQELEDVGVAYHRRPWQARTIGLRQPCNASMGLGQHTRPDDVWSAMPSSLLESDYVGRVIPAFTLGSHTVRLGQRIISVGQHTR